MFFIYPMWDNESERLGKKKCTPIGYALHGVVEIGGLIGLLMLLGTIAVLTYKCIAGTFHVHLLWLFAVPFLLGLLCEVLFRYSWRLAQKKGFRYDYATREASWIEDGNRRVYKWEPPK